jgi:hypothetical protein
MSEQPKKMGRPELPPEQRSKPRTIWMPDSEWAKVKGHPKGWVRELIRNAPTDHIATAGKMVTVAGTITTS